jgi:hypothetical protein
MAGATVMKPLEIDMIDEGQFIENLNGDLKELQRGLLLFAKQYGRDAVKAVAKLNVTIALRVEDDEAGAYSIACQIVPSLPKRPASVSMALSALDDDGKPCLFARASGTDDSDPRQLKFATKRGENIDLETGERMP